MFSTPTFDPYELFLLLITLTLIEAQWMEHWMEDYMLGVGHDKDRDGLGLLQQQLHCAQMEAQLLEIALNQSKSSGH